MEEENARLYLCQKSENRKMEVGPTERAVYFENRRAVPRVARQRHTWSKCRNMIEVGEMYWNVSERYGDEIVWTNQCDYCYSGPRINKTTKDYNYNPKMKRAVSDNAKAELRLHRRPKFFQF